MKTQAAILYRINEPLSIEELEIPELKEGQVLVNLAYSGVCHSQLNEVKGLRGEDRFLPHTLGHEGSGIVGMVGAKVEKVKPGDHVVLTWIKGSGICAQPFSYRRNNGSLVNSGPVSTFLTKAVVSEDRVVKIGNEIPLKEATLLGCAIPTGAGIVLNTAKVNPGSSIAIFGTGGIGLSAILAASFIGANKIIAIDIFEHKLLQAKEMGATDLVNAHQHDPIDAIMKVTNNRGVDYAIESAGRKDTMEMAFKSVHGNGGLCVLAGNLSSGELISINPFDLIKGKRIVGSWGGETDPDRDIPMYIKLYLSGKLKLDKILTHSFKLAEINTAFKALEEGMVGRAIIEL